MLAVPWGAPKGGEACLETVENVGLQLYCRGCTEVEGRSDVGPSEVVLVGEGGGKLEGRGGAHGEGRV